MLKAIGSRKNLEFHPFYDAISDLLMTDEVQQLRAFRHHIQTTRLQHSINVSFYNYQICRFFGWNAVSAARAGLLHDLFFYNRKEYIRVAGESFHNARHPKLACAAADALVPLTRLEKDMILKHMWPVTPLKLPRYRETMVIVLVDKYCALLELTLPLFARLFRRRAKA